MRFTYGKNHEIELIETVGELRAAIAHLPADTPIRFEDPDTDMLMRLAPKIISDVEAGWDDEGRMVFTTEHYSFSPLVETEETPGE